MLKHSFKTVNPLDTVTDLWIKNCSSFIETIWIQWQTYGLKLLQFLRNSYQGHTKVNCFYVPVTWWKKYLLCSFKGRGCTWQQFLMQNILKSLYVRVIKYLHPYKVSLLYRIQGNVLKEPIGMSILEMKTFDVHKQAIKHESGNNIGTMYHMTYVCMHAYRWDGCTYGKRTWI